MNRASWVLISVIYFYSYLILKLSYATLGPCSMHSTDGCVSFIVEMMKP
jgi:hypothetical protein